MNRVLQAPAIFVVLAILTACGGGGDSTTNPGSTQPQPGVSLTQYTQSDVLGIAKLSALAMDDSDQGIELAVGLMGLNLGSSANINSGSTANTENCISERAAYGEVTRVVTKSAVRAGLVAGDRMTVTFTNCDYGMRGEVVYNGSFTLTVNSTLTNWDAARYEVPFQASMTNFSIKIRGVTKTFSGSIDAVAKSDGDGVTSHNLSVPSGQTFSIAGPNLVTTFKAGANFVVTNSLAPASATRKLDGTLSFASTGGTANLDITTHAQLVGSLASGRFIATSGTVTARDLVRNIVTSLAVGGSSVSVGGDTDGNGSSDLVFNSSWTELTQ
jgi:hypothetical protein